MTINTNRIYLDLTNDSFCSEWTGLWKQTHWAVITAFSDKTSCKAPFIHNIGIWIFDRQKGDI